MLSLVRHRKKMINSIMDCLEKLMKAIEISIVKMSPAALVKIRSTLILGAVAMRVKTQRRMKTKAKIILIGKKSGKRKKSNSLQNINRKR